MMTEFEAAATVNEGAKGVQDITEKTTEVVEKTLSATRLADENTKESRELMELVERFKI